MDATKHDVVVVGELNPDLIVSGDVLPEFGQVEKIVDKAVLTIGSSSAIFACGAARLGLRVAFIGKVGNDLFGKFMCQSLSDYGIDTCGVVTDRNDPTGVSIILTTGNDRAILTALGTIPGLEFSEIDLTILKRARHLHVGSYYLQKTLRPYIPNLLKIAHEYGLSTSLDTNYDPDRKWRDGIGQLLDNVDIFLPNSIECCAIAGIPELDDAVNALRIKVKYLGVKCGSEGAFLYKDHEKYAVEPISVQVIDTVGAGDSFDAGFIYGYLAGWEPQKIIKFANLCGGLSTRKSGGTDAQPTYEEAIQFL
jgi:sugar/nucleoside kinase (ribokinase family)